MRKKTKWILGLSIGIPILLVIALLLVLQLSSSNPESDLTAIEIKELPELWEQEAETGVSDASDLPAETLATPPTGVEDSSPSDEPVESTALVPTIESFDLPIAGTLVMVGSDKPFGEETFELAIEGESVVLRSTGKFWFKALIATITLDYDQILEMDARLRPMTLASTFDAPLGFGMDIQAVFTNGGAVIRSGKDVETISVDPENALVRGTFGTYAIIPLLYQLRDIEGVIGLKTLVFGGPPNRDDDNVDGLPETRIMRIEDTTIRFGDRELTVSQYEISGDMGTMMLFARGIELLGLLAGDEEESLFVYRADYFEDGFMVLDSSSD